jgi:hypothetical protein
MNSTKTCQFVILRPEGRSTLEQKLHKLLKENIPMKIQEILYSNKELLSDKHITHNCSCILIAL